MTEGNGTPIGVEGLGSGAGAMLRAAREKRGMHIAALAAAIKVPQRKLEALEADRFDELPDMTFTRALAQTVCRTLRIDAQPVLDRLPHAAESPKLAQVGTGLNAPFRERPGREEPSDWSWMRRPVFWGTLLVLAGAAALALIPERFLSRGRAAAPAPAASAPLNRPTTTPSISTTIVTTPVIAATPVEAPASAAMVPEVPASAPAVVNAPPAAGGSSSLVLQASAASWVEVQDVNGITLLSRSLAAGETAALDGALPLRVTIGNASATKVQFRGQPVDLTPNTVGNVARLQLN